MIIPVKLLSVSVVSLFVFACSDDAAETPAGSGGTSSTGGAAATGGASTGGATTTTGGASTGGVATTTGGASTGGAVTTTGGASTGGAATTTGGAAAGGPNTPPCTAIEAPAGATKDVPKLVIAEIALGGAEEHIVIHNNSTESLALAGYALCSNFFWYPPVTDLTDATMIAPGEFLKLEVDDVFTGLAGNSAEKGELLLFEGIGTPAPDTTTDYICWGVFAGGRKDKEGLERYAGDCAPAMSAGALRRKVGSSGEDAASYDGAVTPSTCAK